MTVTGARSTEPGRLDPSQKEIAARVLARSFQNDPMYRCVIPDEERRAQDLFWLFGRVVQYSILYGEAHATPGMEGVVCWLPPGNAELTLGRMIRTGLVLIVPVFGWSAYRRMDDNMTFVGKLHKQCAPGPHWYLWAIGVDPPHQGRGIGGILMQPMLERARAAGVPVYLETHNEPNVRFYEKHGFVVAQTGVVPGYGIRVWALRRP